MRAAPYNFSSRSKCLSSILLERRGRAARRGRGDCGGKRAEDERRNGRADDEGLDGLALGLGDEGLLGDGDRRVGHFVVYCFVCVGVAYLQSRGRVGYKMKYEGSHKRLDVTTYVVKMYDARVNILCDIVLSCGFTKVPERTWPARRPRGKSTGTTT